VSLDCFILLDAIMRIDASCNHGGCDPFGITNAVKRKFLCPCRFLRQLNALKHL